MTDIHNPRNWHWAFGMPESLENSKVRMAVKTLNIKHNSDETITISANNYRESISIQHKTDIELFEAVKFAIICASFDWTSELEELVRSELSKL